MLVNSISVVAKPSRARDDFKEAMNRSVTERPIMLVLQFIFISSNYFATQCQTWQSHLYSSFPQMFR